MTSLRTAGIVAAVIASVATLSACNQEYVFVPQDTARGPGELAGLSAVLNTTFGGGASPDIQSRLIDGDPDWQNFNADCEAFCASQPFDNPIDEAICPHLWGAGFDTRPVDDEQACRRIFADMRGIFPTYDEIEETCLGRPIANIVEQLIESEEFVFQNQRI